MSTKSCSPSMYCYRWTLFRHRNIHKGTWHGHDDRNCQYQVMNDQCHWSNLLYVRSYRGTDVDSDHYLVNAQMRCCIARRNNRRIPKASLKSNKKRMGINEVKQEYANKLVNWIQEADWKNNLNWKVLQPTAINTADEVKGTEEKNGNEWIVSWRLYCSHQK